MSNIFNMTDVWNNVSTVFTAVKMNATDTASDPASLLMDLQVGGVSQFKVAKSGQSVGISANYTDFIQSLGIIYLGTDAGTLRFGAAADTILARDAANTLAQRNGTAAQTFNIYNSYTDGANYSRLRTYFTSNIAYITQDVAGTGSGLGLVVAAGSTGANSLYLRSNTATAAWQITGGNALAPDTDNSVDLGAAGQAPRYVRASSAIQTKALTVATLPAAATALGGARSFVTDATVTTFASTVVGGGTNAVPVYSDGTNWKIG